MLLEAVLSKFSSLRSTSTALQLSCCFSTRKLFAEKLDRRRLLKITGNDSRDFLQGLITNDVRHLVDGNETSVSLPCIYSMVLNVQGRLLYDVLIYKVRENSPIGSCLLLECDGEIREDLVKHLSRYKLRKKVDLKLIDDLNIFALFDQEGSTEPEMATTAIEMDKGVVIASRDPRLPHLGHRVILESSKEVSNVADGVEVTHANGGKYRDLRHSLGVGEGIGELPPGDCFPLECNGDYLHGVSFTKGCYLGQELTSRIHHTGVIRKRIMPFQFDGDIRYEDVPASCPVVNEDEKSVGKVRSCGPVYGIGLLRVDQTLAAKTLSVKGFGKISTHKPAWWPQGT